MNIKGAVVLGIVLAAAMATVWGGQSEQAIHGWYDVGDTTRGSGSFRGLRNSGPLVDLALGTSLNVSSFRRVIGPAWPDARRYGLSAHGLVVLVGRASGLERVEAVGAGDTDTRFERLYNDTTEDADTRLGVGQAERNVSVEAEVDACPACEGGVDVTSLFHITFYAQTGDPYCPYPCDTTASGARVAPGMAACSMYWPFGSRFAILVGGVVERVVVCLDRGSAVTSPQHLDVFFPTADEGWAWLADVGSWAEVEVLPRLED